MSAIEIQTQKSAVFDRLAALITELDLPPGSRLVESELAKSLNVSKTPIREALLLLQAENLVELKPYQGATVTWLSLEEYCDVHFLLDAIERSALELAIDRLTSNQIKTAGELIDRLRRARASENSMLFGHLTTRIHSTLFSVVRSPQSSKIITALTARSGRRYARVFQHQFSDAWDIELQLIIGRYQGIVEHDPSKAAKEMTEGHKKLQELASQRLQHPAVAPYVMDQSNTDRGIRVIPIRRTQTRIQK